MHINEGAYKYMKNKTERVPVPGYENDYWVGLDVIHQLHCLNMIPKAFYPGWYEMGFKGPNNTFDFRKWVHVGMYNTLSLSKLPLCLSLQLTRLNPQTTASSPSDSL